MQISRADPKHKGEWHGVGPTSWLFLIRSDAGTWGGEGSGRVFHGRRVVFSPLAKLGSLPAFKQNKTPLLRLGEETPALVSVTSPANEEVTSSFFVCSPGVTRPAHLVC